MDSDALFEKGQGFVREHQNLIFIVVGSFLLAGAVMNWNWLCGPTGAPDSHRYGRGPRRLIFFLLGAVLIVVGIWGSVLTL